MTKYKPPLGGFSCATIEFMQAVCGYSQPKGGDSHGNSNNIFNAALPVLFANQANVKTAPV